MMGVESVAMGQYRPKRCCQMLWMKVVRPLGVMGPRKRAYPCDPWV